MPRIIKVKYPKSYGEWGTEAFAFAASTATSVQLVGDFTDWLQKPVNLKKTRTETGKLRLISKLAHTLTASQWMDSGVMTRSVSCAHRIRMADGMQFARWRRLLWVHQEEPAERSVRFSKMCGISLEPIGKRTRIMTINDSIEEMRRLLQARLQEWRLREGQPQYRPKPVVAIPEEPGCGEESIAERLCAELGFHLYRWELVEQISSSTWPWSNRRPLYRS